MAHLVPSLKMMERTTLKKVRRFGENGNILVDVGEVVGAHEVVARASRQSKPIVVDVAKELQLSDSGQVAHHLLKTIGQQVQRGEVIARKKGALGRGQKTCSSPIDGVLSSGPTRAGEVLINPHPRELELLALVSGRIAAIVPSRGVAIETTGAYLHAATGVGADTFGAIKLMSGSPTHELAQQSIDESCSGCVLVSGTVGVGAIRSAVMAGARAIVVGSVAGSTFEWILETPQPITVIITEGIGLPGMSRILFELLRERSGETAGLFVPTRSKWRRYPSEIIIPDSGAQGAAPAREFGAGSTVRIVRGDGFGELATVVDLPAGKRSLQSGVVTEVVELATGSGDRRIVARTNVEFVV